MFGLVLILVLWPGSTFGDLLPSNEEMERVKQDESWDSKNDTDAKAHMIIDRAFVHIQRKMLSFIEVFWEVKLGPEEQSLSIMSGTGIELICEEPGNKTHRIRFYNGSKVMTLQDGRLMYEESWILKVSGLQSDKDSQYYSCKIEGRFIGGVHVEVMSLQLTMERCLWRMLYIAAPMFGLRMIWNFVKFVLHLRRRCQYMSEIRRKIEADREPESDPAKEEKFQEALNVYFDVKDAMEMMPVPKKGPVKKQPTMKQPKKPKNVKRSRPRKQEETTDEEDEDENVNTRAFKKIQQSVMERLETEKKRKPKY